MTIATYKAQYLSLRSAHLAGEMGTAAYIKAVTDLNEKYISGKGSWLLPMVD